MTERRYKFWGWGYEDEVPSPEEEREAVARMAAATGVEPGARIPFPRIGDVALREPRVAAPAPFAAIASADPYDRASHTYGKSFPDYVRALAGDFAAAPDLVFRPRAEEEVAAVLDWAEGARVAVIPFGAGSSVVGGIEPAVGGDFAAAVSVDLRAMDRVTEVDEESRAARIEGGALGPVLEAQLKPRGLTLRHFPQSYSFSTLGGWIATRSGGHFATLHTHIEELVESLRVVTPRGVLESRRLPGSGAGPSPDRFFAGSEGALGIIVAAWMRVFRRPSHRRAAAAWFESFEAAAGAVRAVVQAGLWPANCRLVDSEEARLAGAGDGSGHLVVVSFESAERPVDAWMDLALACVRDCGGAPEEEGGGGAPNRRGAAGAWRDAFIRAPYVRETLIANGFIADTFETAVTWDRLADFHREVKAATEDAIVRATGRPGHVTCRFTHAYPDGAAPYFTFHARAPEGGGALAAWREIKEAASEALLAAGGTITHHHAVGRDHMPWYVRQRPERFGRVLAAAKRELDPAGIMNPGVIVEAA